MSCSHELFIMRHAKSDWGTGAASDYLRPITADGLKDAIAIAETMRTKGSKPDAIYSSTAVRAKSTCESVSKIIGFNASSITWEESIYESSLTTLLTLMNSVDEAAGTIMLVGHNPGLEQLLLFLCPDALPQSNGKLLTTSNLVRIGLNCSWREVGKACGDLLYHLRPKELNVS